jgi:mono/diheme cytochrome c family protein
MNSLQKPHGRPANVGAYGDCVAAVMVFLAFAGVLAGNSRQLSAADPPTNVLSEEEEFFERRVRPILLERCASCHGAQKQWGQLRLDRKDLAFNGGETGVVLVPGKPDESRLIEAVRRSDELAMPPDEPLPDAEVAVLTEWVARGAVWPADRDPKGPSLEEQWSRHWAFQPLQDAAIPNVQRKEWCQNDVDRFILSTLEREGLQPSPPADRRTLLRRVTYDLTGLPPTADDVTKFVNDPRPEAYAELVDRLLASPEYAEHWGRHWLDVTRYSDTKGYVYAREERFFVQAAAYRDWVVQAFQQDLPYNRFLELQIAADQVAPEDPSALAAMGLLTLGRRFLGVTHEIIDDRIDVVTRGTMALTVACARCHDHKYDPIPTADYYSLYGVFQNSTERQVEIVPVQGAGEAVDQYRAELDKRREALRTKLVSSQSEQSARARARVTDYLLAQTELEKYPAEGFDQVLSVTDVIPAFVRRWEWYLAGIQDRPGPIWRAWFELMALPDGDDFAARAQAVIAAWQQDDPSQIHPRLKAVFPATDPPTSRRNVAERYGSVFLTIDHEWQDVFAKSTGTHPEGLSGPVSAAKPANVVAAERPIPSGAESQTGAVEALPVTALPDPQDEALRQVLYAPWSPSVIPAEAIVSTETFYDSATCTQLWQLQGEVDRWVLNSPLGPTVVVKLEDRAALREPKILRRGNPKLLGDRVPRQFLQVIAGDGRQPFQQGSGRRELAAAIVDPSNPLTPRVWVNRLWQHHFGQGLVTTASDFGLRAQPPSHPELLDWLARQLIAQGWSTKAMHRLMLLSATYQQQSATSSIDAEQTQSQSVARRIDPENRWLSRMNPHRLSFEEFRDTALALSQELDRTRGGKAQPLLDPQFRRRTLYGLIDRQFLPSVLRVFDFANPDLHVAQRSETTVPQQALFAWNHPFLADRARTLVDVSGIGRIRPSDAAGTASAVAELYQRVLQRDPTPYEVRVAQAYLSAAEHEAVPQVSLTARSWEYGTAELDPAQGTLKQFTRLPFFNGTAWQGGAAWPDNTWGWAQLTATGGHPGNDLKHAVVRRWTAPRTMTIRIDSQLRHEPAAGDGVRGWIRSSRQGVLAQHRVHQTSVPLVVESLAVQAGDQIDFIVDIADGLNSDQFLWAPVIQAVADPTVAGDAPAVWSAEKDFFGPEMQRLLPWQQLAQVLLLSNEVLFVD